MELHEYPRPANDTGIGIHWTTGYATAIGMRQIRDFWIPELRALGVKWLKIYNHDGALNFAELLLAEGFMPVVRIYRPAPNPSRLDVKDVVQIDAFLRAGVRYFEFNSEPDRDAEWKGGRMPANGINLVVENTIANLEIILERGGMPAVPAVSNGSRWDLVGKIIAFGRKDLFAGPVWQAIHNYPRNRPLDYPYDIGNQEGAAYTYRFYQTLNEERWNENAWRGRALDEINRLRHDRSNPGATIMDDAACWLAYEYFDTLNRKHLGHSIPILSTECGYLVGEDLDPRYPATTPDLHMAQTLETCRVMMGTSQRFAPAPDYYFCTAFWLIANAQLGSTSSWWENHAWYSERWPGGALPTSLALKAEPKVARHWQAAVAQELVTLYGAVAHAGAARVVVLERNGEEVARATLDENSSYTFAELAPGAYRLAIAGTATQQQVELVAGQQELMVNFDLTPASTPVSKSRIEGTVRGGAGAVLLLVRSNDGEEWVSMARDDGVFRFVDLPAGEYSLRVNPQGSRLDRLMLDGINQRQVELAVAGWGYTIQHGPPNAKLNSLFCVVEGHRRLPVQLHAGTWSSEALYTGTAPEAGPFACEFTGVEPGHYIITVENALDEAGRAIQLEARIHVDRKRVPLVEFIYTDLQEQPQAQQGGIVGRVIGGNGERGRRVCLVDNMGQRQEQAIDNNGAFAFDHLAAGRYMVALVGQEDAVNQSDIALDGVNTVRVELRAPVTRAQGAKAARQESVVVATVPDGRGRLAQLVDTVGNAQQQYVDSDDHIRFTELAVGVYTLTVEGGYRQSNLTLDGTNGVEIFFAELSPSWEAEVSHAGPMPGYSVVRVEVEGMAELPVHIWKEDWEGMMRRTGSKPEYGPYVLEFSPLGVGRYMVEPEGLGLWADVELTGLEAVWIHFRRRTLPLDTNLVQALNQRTAPLANIIDASAPTAPAVEPIIGETASSVETMPQQSATARDEPTAVGTTAAYPTIQPPPQTVPNPQAESAAAFSEQPLAAGQSSTYLFVYAPPTKVDDLMALLQFVDRTHPQVGRDRWAAFEAEQVIIIAGEEHTLELTEFVRALTSASVEVRLLTHDLGQGLAE